MPLIIHHLAGSRSTPLLEEVLRLRARLFRGVENAGADHDEFDDRWQHLAICDESGRVRGTCRYRHHPPEQLTPARLTRESYAARFFQLESCAWPDQGIFEVGRLAVDTDDGWARTAVLRLLFAALLHLAGRAGKPPMLGCVTLPANVSGSMEASAPELSDLPTLPAAMCPPPRNRGRPSGDVAAAIGASHPDPAASALLAAYRALGARFSPAPAQDPDLCTWVCLAILEHTALTAPIAMRLERLLTSAHRRALDAPSTIGEHG